AEQDRGAGDARPRRGRVFRRPHRPDASRPYRPAGHARRDVARAGRSLRASVHPGPARSRVAAGGDGMRRLGPLFVLLAAAAPLRAAEPAEIRVGSKKFTESVILGEMACYLIRDAGARAVHIREMGTTPIVWKALLKGEIDLYPEYTGTLLKDI